MAANTGPTPSPSDLAHAQELLEHFERLEAQFQQVRQELTHSHRLATLGTLASMVAHEYNNILTPIISYAQLALSKPQDQALLKKAVEKALLGAERAAKISSSLLGFSRPSDQRPEAELAAVVQETFSCLAREPRKDGIDLTVDVGPWRVAMSPLNLQQVLLNLVLNARQAMAGRGGQLHITACEQGPLVHLSVADTGPGIPSAVMERLFEPFVTQRQGEGDAAERHGTGLGLCICRDLVRSAGGSIHVQSTPGQGTTFQILLPKAEPAFETT